MATPGDHQGSLFSKVINDLPTLFSKPSCIFCTDVFKLSKVVRAPQESLNLR